MKQEDMGVAPASQPPGHQPSASAAKEASSQSGVPNAETCPTCHGTGEWRTDWGGPYPCSSCELPPEEKIAFVLKRLNPDQRAMLLFGADTMAEQDCTPETWDGVLLCGFYVEEDDEADLGDGLIWPATKHWFAGSCAHYMGDGGPWHLSFRYNALGMVLRSRLTASAAGPGTAETPSSAAQGEAGQSGGNEDCRDAQTQQSQRPSHKEGV